MKKNNTAKNACDGRSDDESEDPNQAWWQSRLNDLISGQHTLLDAQRRLHIAQQARWKGVCVYIPNVS
jgi:hypothetical protein